MTYGLTTSELTDIVNLFKNIPQIEKAILFGSRAKGNFRPGSDINIALYGPITHDLILNIQIKADELDILQKIDLVNAMKVTNSELLEHIERVGIEFYRK